MIGPPAIHAYHLAAVVWLQVDQIVALRSEALQLNENLRLAQLDKTEGEGHLQILKDKIAAKNLEGER